MDPLDRSSAFPASTAAAERVTSFLRAVYGWMFVGLGITAFVAYALYRRAEEYQCHHERLRLRKRAQVRL